MKIGVFDHLDNDHLPIHVFLEERLRLIELYDRAGFHAYHLAEHHGTALGMAPSPNVFLSAVAQRTRELLFGPMVYALPLYQPLRLAQEICMLDQLSGGRLQIGFGRGSSPVEIAFYGLDPKATEDIFQRDLPRILSALDSGIYDAPENAEPFRRVELKVATLQRPHPPVWYGVHSPESAERAARRGWHMISLDSAEEARACTDVCRRVWRETRPDSASLLGLGRFIVVAPTDEEAQALARRAYPAWHRAFTHLARTLGSTARHPRPDSWDALHAQGKGVAGSPETVAAFCNRQMEAAGCTYLVGQFAFGDLTAPELARSLDLFARDVRPVLRTSH